MRITCSQHFRLQFEGVMYAFTGCGLSACYRFDLFVALSGMFEVCQGRRGFAKRKHLLPQPKCTAVKVCLKISWVALHVSGENVGYSVNGIVKNGWPSGKIIKLEACFTSCTKMNLRWIKGLNVNEKKVWYKKIVSDERGLL